MKSKFFNNIIIILFIVITVILAYILFYKKDDKGISDLKLDKTIISLYVNDTEKLNLSIIPNNTNETDIIWTSSNEEVASVTNDGFVTANSVGNATITVNTKDGKIGCNCFVEVKKKSIERIELDIKSVELKIGEIKELNASIFPEEFNSTKINWISSNSDVIKVDNGIITAINTGDAIVTASVDNVEAKCIVKVKKTDPTPVITTPLSPKPTVTPEPLNLEMHFINAGGFYDDAILIRTNKSSIWIDGGRGTSEILKYLDELKIKTIDYVIGSHTEYDHIDSEGEIIKKYNVKHAIYANSITKCGCSCDSKDVKKVLAALNSKNITPTVQKVPSKLEIGDMTLYFIAPISIGCNKNNNSFIFILEFGNNKFMFTGDSDSILYQPNQLLANAKQLGLNDLHVDVIKYPHHGNQAIPDVFLEATKPKYFIVPNMNTSDKPTQTMRNKIASYGAKIYRQSDSKTGNVLIKSDGNNITFTMDVIPSTYAK